jgi:hypothetical protein
MWEELMSEEASDPRKKSFDTHTFVPVLRS